LKKTQAMIANLCLSNKPVTYSRVLYDVLVGSGLQRVEKPRFSRKLPHFLLSNQKLCKIFDLVI